MDRIEWIFSHCRCGTTLSPCIAVCLCAGYRGLNTPAIPAIFLGIPPSDVVMRLTKEKWSYHCTIACSLSKFKPPKSSQLAGLTGVVFVLLRTRKAQLHFSKVLMTELTLAELNAKLPQLNAVSQILHPSQCCQTDHPGKSKALIW